VSFQHSLRVKRVAYLFQYVWVLIESFLSGVAVLLLSKLRDIQALCLGQIVFRRQLALIIGDIVVGFILIFII